jgi:hypothetical protein
VNHAEPAYIVFDISAIVIMVILGYLSRRLGEALKIAPYYKLLYVTAAAVFLAFAVDTLPDVLRPPAVVAAAMIVRLVAGAVALIVCLRYWRWLFNEYIKH